MPDIAKCANNDCPLRNQCYRFRCKPDDWQSYSDFQPSFRKEFGVWCENFWDIEGYPERMLLPVDYKCKIKFRRKPKPQKKTFWQSLKDVFARH